MKSIGSSGEFGLINYIKKGLYHRSEIVKSLGDDCAVMRPGRKRDLIVTTDMICEGVHFIRKGTEPALIGRKAMAVNISDIAACGGEAVAAFVSMSLPGALSARTFRDIYGGIKRMAREYHIEISGGDLSRLPKIVIAITLIGYAPKKGAILRGGAKIGDAIYVTGCLGRGNKNHHLTFTPRINEARILSGKFDIHSMIDVSDGLISDLGHIVEESGIGARVDLERIPKASGCRSLRDALAGGEDFELIFTLSQKDAKRLEGVKKSLFRTRLTRIGQITESGFYLSDGQGGRKDPAIYRGYNHFDKN